MSRYRPPRPSSVLLVVPLALAALVGQPAAAQKGGPERGRILFVVGPDENDKSLVKQYDMLQRDAGEVNGADVDVVYVVGQRSVKLPPPDAKTESADELRKHYHVDAAGFRVVLVGDDGWEKKRWAEPTEPHVIVSRAPDMPQPKSKTEDQH